ncbi:MAG: hypothetical protein M0R46_11285 [Candidatus Muirbacterium halophilum]|nr:hypothetical protein [Candidatus Muirbacterium halophilum]MCK9476496.1 hypothetical protein [Candidatus Muirbacterium halophilum]
MKKVLFMFLVFSVFIGSISVSAGILTRTKLRLLEKSADIYTILDENYNDNANAPEDFIKVKALSELAVNYLYSGTHETTFSMLKNAETICDSMQNDYYKAYGYAKIACAYAEFKNMLGIREKSKAAADKGIAVVAKLYNSHEKVRMYNGFIRILMNIRYYKQVNELIAINLIELENISDVYYKSLCALDLAAFVSIMKDNETLVNNLFDISYNETQNMNDAFNKSIILCEIADYSFIRNNNEIAGNFIDQAINAANNTEDSYYKHKAFSKIAKVLLVNGNFQKANSIISNECKQALNNTSDNYYKALELVETAGIYYVIGNKEKAYEYLLECEQNISQIEDFQLKVLVNNKLFWVYYIFEDNNKAIEINNNSYKYAQNLNTITIIANNYAILRDFDKANEILLNIK